MAKSYRQSRLGNFDQMTTFATMKPLIKYFFLIASMIIFTSCESTTTENGQTPGLEDDYEKFGRAAWQHPDLVIDQFGNLEGKVIADIGAGTGFFSKRLAKKGAKVIAIDIDRRFIHLLDSIRVKDLPEAAQNLLITRIAKLDDPMLAAHEVDGALIVNTFMYMSDRVDYLKKVFEGIKPNGKLIIVDFKKIWTPIGPPKDIRLDMEEVSRIVKEAGFTITKTDKSSLPYQYIVVGEKRN